MCIFVIDVMVQNNSISRHIGHYRKLCVNWYASVIGHIILFQIDFFRFQRIKDFANVRILCFHFSFFFYFALGWYLQNPLSFDFELFFVYVEWFYLCILLKLLQTDVTLDATDVLIILIIN